MQKCKYRNEEYRNANAKKCRIECKKYGSEMQRCKDRNTNTKE
jgi:hypothetical protein